MTTPEAPTMPPIPTDPRVIERSNALGIRHTLAAYLITLEDRLTALEAAPALRAVAERMDPSAPLVPPSVGGWRTYESPTR